MKLSDIKHMINGEDKDVKACLECLAKLSDRFEHGALIGLDIRELNQEELKTMLNYQAFAVEQMAQANIVDTIKRVMKREGMDTKVENIDKLNDVQKAYYAGASDAVDSVFQDIYKMLFSADAKHPKGKASAKTLLSILKKIEKSDLVAPLKDADEDDGEDKDGKIERIK